MGYRRHRAGREEELARPVARPAPLSRPRARDRRIARALACGALLLALPLASACAAAAPPPGSGDLTLTIGVAEGAASSDEQGAQQIVNAFVREGLTQLSADGRVQPRVAASWRWEDNGSTLRVVLRPDVKFHDNTPVTAAVVADLLRPMVTDIARQSVYPSFEDITSIEPDGVLDLLIHVSRFSALLPEDLSFPLVRPEAFGTGPYRVVPATTAGDFELRRFDAYYMGRPAIGHVILRPFETLRTTWSSLLRGDVDMATEVPPSSIDFVRNDDVQVFDFKRWYQYLLAFNSAKGPLRHPQVRLALNLAVDRERLIQRVMQGKASPAYGPIWPGFWAHDATVAPYAFDPDMAARLLDEAGFPLPAVSERADAPPARFRFVCLVPENLSTWERIALEVQRSLFMVGVDVQFKTVSLTEFGESIGAGQFDAALIDLISGPTVGRAYVRLRSAAAFKGTTNTLGYENAEAEDLFNVLRRSSNEAAIRTATGRLQRVLLDDPPALFLAWSERSRAIRREFRVVQEGERDPLSSLWRWTAADAPQIVAAQ